MLSIDNRYVCYKKLSLFGLSLIRCCILAYDRCTALQLQAAYLEWTYIILIYEKTRLAFMLKHWKRQHNNSMVLLLPLLFPVAGDKFSVAWRDTLKGESDKWRLEDCQMKEADVRPFVKAAGRWQSRAMRVAVRIEVEWDIGWKGDSLSWAARAVISPWAWS